MKNMTLSSLLNDENFISPIIISLKVAVSATILSFISAILIHYLFSRKYFKGKTILEAIIMLPMVLPPTVVGFLLLILFGKQSFMGKFIELLFHQPIIFTIYAAIAASTLVALPLMYQSIKIGIEQIPENLYHVAQLDGASKFRMFTHITLPLSKAALLTGTLLAFARAIGEFGATLIFAGNIPGVTETMPTAIYVAIENNDLHLAYAWVFIMIVMSFFMMIATQLLRK